MGGLLAEGRSVTAAGCGSGVPAATQPRGRPGMLTEGLGPSHRLPAAN